MACALDAAAATGYQSHANQRYISRSLVLLYQGISLMQPRIHLTISRASIIRPSVIGRVVLADVHNPFSLPEPGGTLADAVTNGAGILMNG